MQQATLDALAAAAAEQLKEELTPMIGRFAAALADLSQPGMDSRDVYRQVRSGKLLKDNSYAFYHLASTGIELALRRELDSLQPRPAASQGAPAALSLVPLEVMDSKVAFGAITRPFDIQHSEQLATLSVRLGLLLGRGVLRADANPFRP
jgi:CheY-like chemotaxis protein